MHIPHIVIHTHIHTQSPLLFNQIYGHQMYMYSVRSGKLEKCIMWIGLMHMCIRQIHVIVQAYFRDKAVSKVHPG
jgi:hypothetical protein